MSGRRWGVLLVILASLVPGRSLSSVRGKDGRRRGGQQGRRPTSNSRSHQSQQRQRQQQQQRAQGRPQPKIYRASIVDCDVIPSTYPRIVHRDAKLLVVAKPAGWRTTEICEPSNEATQTCSEMKRPSLQLWLRDSYEIEILENYSFVSSAAVAIDSSGLVVFQNSCAENGRNDTYLHAVTSTVAIVVDGVAQQNHGTFARSLTCNGEGPLTPNKKKSDSEQGALLHEIEVMKRDSGHGTLLATNLTEKTENMLHVSELGFISYHHNPTVEVKGSTHSRSTVATPLIKLRGNPSKKMVPSPELEVLVAERGIDSDVRRQLADAATPVRGDARFGDSVDRRAPRALWHCWRVTLHSPARGGHDADQQRVFELPNDGWPQDDDRSGSASGKYRYLPCDMKLAAGCRSHEARADLDADPSTTCYRLLHAGADVHAATTNVPPNKRGESSSRSFAGEASAYSVDRYADWLVVQHNLANDDEEKGLDQGRRDSSGLRLPPVPTSAEDLITRLELQDHIVLAGQAASLASNDESSNVEPGENKVTALVKSTASLAAAQRGPKSPVKGVFYSVSPRDRSKVPTKELLRLCSPRLLASSAQENDDATSDAAPVAADLGRECESAATAGGAGLTVLEHGVAYHVTLGGADGLSTGLFLDQRPQRTWLRNHLSDGDRLLNCFAHAGGYSVAAAAAGASTTSLDLSKAWLGRVPESLALNGISEYYACESTKNNHVRWDEDGSGDGGAAKAGSNEEEETGRRIMTKKKKHDTIYGDCFDWLKRLRKRIRVPEHAEDDGNNDAGGGSTRNDGRFDVVILDPPTTSTGPKKKRWTAARDYPELVALAAPLVAPGGALWTTTNHRGTQPHHFASLVEKGLRIHEQETKKQQPAPARNAEDILSSCSLLYWTLEKSCAPAVDFPCSAGEPPHVKTLVWRRALQ